MTAEDILMSLYADGRDGTAGTEERPSFVKMFGEIGEGERSVTAGLPKTSRLPKKYRAPLLWHSSPFRETAAAASVFPSVFAACSGCAARLPSQLYFGGVFFPSLWRSGPL